jgi:hypothetical protein
MAVKKIRDMQTIIGMLEGGALNAELSEEVTTTLGKLADMSTERSGATFKGETKLTLNFEVKDGMVVIRTEFASKTPKRPRRTSMFWIVEDGALSAEHPQQHDLFGGPRGVAETA